MVINNWINNYNIFILYINCVSSVQVCRVIINILAANSPVWFSLVKNSFVSYAKARAEVIHDILCQAQILRAFLLNIVIHIDCANEIQETTKMTQ